MEKESSVLRNVALKYILFIFRYIIGFLPIIYILHLIEMDQLKATFVSTARWTFPLVTFFTLFVTTIQGIRWGMLLRAFVPNITYRRAISYHFISSFYSLILPTGISQDIVKTLLVSTKETSAYCWGATWICRIFGLFSLSIFCLYGLMTLTVEILPLKMKFFIFCAILSFFCLFLISFSKRLTRPFRPVINKILPSRVANSIENIRQGIYIYRDKKNILILVGILTFIITGSMVLCWILILKCITNKLFIGECVIFLPLIEICSIVQPLTPGGVGVREALSALLFREVGFSIDEIGIFVILLVYGNLMRGSGAIFLMHGIAKKIRNAVRKQDLKKQHVTSSDRRQPNSGET